MPYWIDSDHVYEPMQVAICIVQIMVPEENICFRYEGSIVITKDDCDVLGNAPMKITEL